MPDLAQLARGCQQTKRENDKGAVTVKEQTGVGVVDQPDHPAEGRVAPAGICPEGLVNGLPPVLFIDEEAPVDAH